jgi:hypothetical protein
MFERSKLPLFPNQDLAEQMKLVLDDLECQSLKAIQRQSNGRIQLGLWPYTIKILYD